jgi:hypothetical protein
MIDIDKIEAAASADKELDEVTVLRPAVVMEMVSMIRERDAALEQALEFTEFCWRDVQMNDYAHEQLDQTREAIRKVLEP